jgi:N-acylneuraminate cytidylyltransferase
LINGLRVLAFVPARGGSKGLPRKNIIDLAGRPLIAWTLDAARQSRYIDRCVVSTDDSEIAKIARDHGGDVPFMRPAELAGDSAETFDALAHMLSLLPPFDVVVTLQPTSPLRTALDIDGTLETLVENDAPSCVSVTEPGKSPYWSYRIDEANHLDPLLGPSYSRMRRQELPNAYVLNGAVYATRTGWLLENRGSLGTDTVAYVMPAERSIDIDNAFDLDLAGFMLRRQANSPAQAVDSEIAVAAGRSTAAS